MSIFLALYGISWAGQQSDWPAVIIMQREAQQTPAQAGVYGNDVVEM
jgi:hypothetical protein